jgi:multiple sugar transport system permease protein
VDGAGHWKIFWSIVAPISRTAIITAALFSFLAGWGDFIFALTLTTSSDLTPITVGIYRYLGTYSVNWPAIMAFAQRYIAAGITACAVKE